MIGYYEIKDLINNEIIGYQITGQFSWQSLSNAWTQCYSCTDNGIFSTEDTVIEFRRIIQGQICTALIKFPDSMRLDRIPGNPMDVQTFEIIRQRAELVRQAEFLLRTPQIRGYLERQIMALDGMDIV